MQDILPNIPAGYPMTAVAVLLALIWYRLAHLERSVKDLRERLLPMWYWFEREVMPTFQQKGDK